MRTTLDIPADLLEEAMRITQSKTKNEMIQKVLKDYIARVKRQKLITMKGTLDLDINLDELRGRNHAKV